MWHYSLIMYSLTNKNNYKFGCLQNIKVREDSIAPVRTIIEQYGTLSAPNADPRFKPRFKPPTKKPWFKPRFERTDLNPGFKPPCFCSGT